MDAYLCSLTTMQPIRYLFGRVTKAMKVNMVYPMLSRDAVRHKGSRNHSSSLHKRSLIDAHPPDVVAVIRYVDSKRWGHNFQVRLA